MSVKPVYLIEGARQGQDRSYMSIKTGHPIEGARQGQDRSYVSVKTGHLIEGARQGQHSTYGRSCSEGSSDRRVKTRSEQVI